MNKNCLMIFLKEPVPGEVKTRLAKDIGAEKAARLYQCFMTDTILNAKKLELDIYLCYSPEKYKDELQSQWGDLVHYCLQAGVDLGAKMYRCFQYTFSKGYERVVVIGTDSPDLPVEKIGDSFSQLETNNVVIGPSDDGGYYLIGFQKESLKPYLFRDIEWSTAEVCSQTIEHLDALNEKYKVLTGWTDVDDINDLKLIIEQFEPKSGQLANTWNYISSELSELLP